MTDTQEAANLTGNMHLWQITTAASTYLIDMDGGTLTRVPDSGLGSTDGAPVLVANLRNDFQPITLLSVLECGLGEALVVLLRIRNDCDTTRTTTEVREIKRR